MENNSDLEGRLLTLLGMLKDGTITPEACAEAVEELTGESLPRISVLLVAEGVMEKVKQGEIGVVEAEERLRDLSNRHPALPLPFLCLGYLAMQKGELLKGFGYLALYKLKNECIKEPPTFGRDTEMEKGLRGVEFLWEEELELLSVWPYLGKVCDHLEDHFLLQMLADDTYVLEEDLVELLLEREERLWPIMIALLHDYLEMIAYDISIPPSRMDLVEALLATREDLDLVPLFLDALDVFAGGALNEAILALARLGARYPREVSLELRERARDPEAGEIRLAAVDTLGILVGKRGNLAFLSRMLENLSSGRKEVERADELFAFLCHAILRSRGERAKDVVREALASCRRSLKEGTLEFVEDCLAHHARVRLGPSLRDITVQDVEDLLFCWYDFPFRVRRATLTLRREISVQEEKMAEMPAVSLQAVEDLLRKGHNEPCFCGSGLKFKKCCLRRLEEMRAGLLKDKEGEAKVGKSPFADVLDTLNEFSHLPSLEHERTEATEEFFGSAYYLAIEGDPWSEMELSDEAFFHNWFLLTRPLGTTGKTVAREFLERHGNKVGPLHAPYFKAAAEARFSLFEVREVFLGSGMLLRDLFRGDELKVQERTASMDLVAWDILGGFVGPKDEGYQLLGYGFRVPRLLLDRLEEEVEESYRKGDTQGKGGGHGRFPAAHGIYSFPGPGVMLGAAAPAYRHNRGGGPVHSLHGGVRHTGSRRGLEGPFRAPVHRRGSSGREGTPFRLAYERGDGGRSASRRTPGPTEPHEDFFAFSQGDFPGGGEG